MSGRDHDGRAHSHSGFVDPTMTPGVFVVCPDHPEWGRGQVQSAVGAKITVNFEHQGKLVLDLRHARLEAAPRL